jgi:transcriptional regulator with XRE-family HTH domain
MGYQGKLGARLRQLRIARGMSVRTLAARSGFSPSFISQIESDQASPSIGSLDRIAGQLGVSLGQLFTSLEETPRAIVRRDERITFESSWSRSFVEALTDSSSERQLSAVLVRFDANGSSGKRVAPSQQDTFAYVLSGELELLFEAEDQVHVLQYGDSVYLREGDVFLVRNHRTEQAELLLVSVAGRLDFTTDFPMIETNDE